VGIDAADAREREVEQLHAKIGIARSGVYRR
jgi:hypothetical protein